MALSAQTYQGDGSNTDFVLDFTLGYISESHIHVYVDDEEVPQNTLQFILGGGSVRLPTAPASGSEVLVRRIVPNDKLLHDYENGSLIIESNLDESNLQSIMLQHEAVDGFSTGIYGDINFFTEISDSPEDTAESPRGVEQVTITGLASLAEEQREEFETTFNAQFVYKRVGNLSDYSGTLLNAVDKLNSYQYPDDSGNWYAPIQGQTFPYTLPIDPTGVDSGMVLTSSVGTYQGLWPDTGGSANKGDTYQTQVSGTPTGQYFTALQNTTVDPVGDDVNWRVVVSEKWAAYNFSNTNLLSNHNFLVASPDDITHPSSTPTDYASGTQIFSGVFVGSAIVGLTYINGQVKWTNPTGTIYLSTPNPNGLEYVTQFTASVADFEGKPRTRGVSFALVGNEYRVTVDIDALEDESANETLLGSVKFEQGSVATRHEAQSDKGQAVTFNTVAEMIASGAPVGSKVQWLGYHKASDGGSNWGVVRKGSHVEDGGTVFSINVNTYVEANHAGNRFSVKKFGAKGGLADDTTPILSAINAFRNATFESRARLIFPTDSYLCKDAWNFSGLGRVNRTIDGKDSTVNFEGLGGRAAIVDCVDSREILWKDIFLAYPGSYDRDPSECPDVGLLLGRNSSNDFSGKHKMYNVTVTGTFQLAAKYNAGTEENSFYSCEFRNNLLDRRSMVVTCSNHLGATSEYSSITTTPISMTMNTYIRPRFSTDGDGGRESVCLRGVGGMTMINPYSTSGFTAHYAVQAIDQAVSSLIMLGYQNEVDRGSSGQNATCDIRIEGDGTKDVTGIEINQQLSTASNGVLIDNPRRIRRSKINLSQNIGPFGGGISSGELINCEILGETGVDLSQSTSVTSCEIYANLINDILVPSNLTRSTQIFASDLDSPVSVGTLKQKATATTVYLDALQVRLSGSGNVSNFDSDVSGLPYIAQKFYIDNSNPSNAMIIENNNGNIRTSSGADITLSSQFLEVTYIGSLDLYFISELGVI